MQVDSSKEFQSFAPYASVVGAEAGYVSNPPFIPFPKIARLSRECVITEKIDGTNASIYISEWGTFHVGSRTRWITPADDNYGFAKWATENCDELMRLGPGAHFGEWWGQGIQRNYSQTRKRFSLFNTHRWSDASVRPECCDVVPVLYAGLLDEFEVLKGVKSAMKQLREQGSAAAPGFMNAEGIVVWHSAAQLYLKKTLHKDEEWKGKTQEPATSAYAAHLAREAA